MTTSRKPGFPVRLSGGAKPAGNASGAARAAARPAATAQGLGMDSDAVRQRMVRRLADAGIRRIEVLQAMGSVPRHLFVETALAAQAYEETSLPIGWGQTISKPAVVARMVDLMLGAPGMQTPGKLARVLEIGTGCGYQAAVLAQLVREVYTVERLRAMHERARDRLRPLRLANVHLILGDGMLGYAPGAPYAGIIAAAGGAQLPAAWCEQLAVGGRLVAPVVGTGGAQALMVVDRTAQGFVQNVLEAVHFVPLKSGVA
ncbi:MAG: hypothetical protein HKUEN07_36800 [Rhodocyclaceae bacterium]|nr:MAG: hypothetical protein HKUEN07_36800 [Rhodocyclaceae bacterium]